MENYNYLFAFLIIYLVGVLVFYFLPRKKQLSETFITIAEAIMFGGIIYMCLVLSTYEAIGDSVWMEDNTTKLLSQGFWGFYDNRGIIYPPLYNYLYYIVGTIDNMLMIPIDWTSKLFILSGKIPNLTALLLMTFFIYKTGEKVKKENQLLLFFMSLYQPGYLLAGVLVLQFDPLYTSFAILTLLLLYKGKLKWAYFAFAAGLMFKYQILFISPIILWVTIDKVILKNFTLKNFNAHLIAGVCAIGFILLAHLPFFYSLKNGFTADSTLTSNFEKSVVGFQRASTNGYNFWTLLGYNMESADSMWGPFTCATWGHIFLLMLIIISGILYFKYKGIRECFPMIAAFMTSGIFCFENKMMARYLYPTIILLVFAYAIHPTMKRLIASVLFSCAFFINIMYDFFIIPYAKAYDHSRPEPYIFSAFMLFFFGYLCYVIISEIKNPAVK